ncbi:hypothetical protein [Caulobacter sp. SSI4214]|uniref:hypothetical protein n=1 Tax=Caulobacter sp. SSI4214 TaxID=2575739 RepID=UPI00143BE765|nr:hypothetical protein [Caulobacter sp. SSI4214]
MGVLVGAVGGFLIAATTLGKIVQETTEQSARRSAADQDLLMRTFRRELGNWLFKTNPDRYIALYARARAIEADILSADATTRHALLKRIAADTPFISDFDFVGSREHVLYSDALGTVGHDEVEENYLNIIRWQSLQIAGDPAWKYVAKPTSDSDAEHAITYAKRLKDTRFKKRLNETMRLYWFARNTEKSLDLNNDFFSVRYVHHFAENRYGIHLKDTNEFGLFSVFDDGERRFESYYRSSPDFSEEIVLDATVQE